MFKDIIVAIVSGLICSALTLLVSRLYFGYKHFGGIKNTARLNKDCYRAGIINVFPDRKAYIQHKDHGNSNDYILKAHHNVLYVGYWLATAAEIGELKQTIKQLVSKQITVTLVFISPKNKYSLDICSNYIAISSEQIAQRVKTVIENLLEFRETLESDNKKYLEIKTHNIPLSTTAFIIDKDNVESCRILLDYKVFGCSRESSYGIEFFNKTKTVTNKLVSSYINIEKNSKEIKSIQDL